MLLYLIGMMASGKTTIGKELANKLNYQFVDLDEVIELKHQKKVKDIIELQGIDYFRQVEYDVLRNVKLDINTVIATGGGVVVNDENILYMKNHGVVIYLKVSLDLLNERLNKTNLANRPLLKEQSLNSIFQKRKQLYKNACRITVYCDDFTVGEICIQIMEQLTLS